MSSDPIVMQRGSLALKPGYVDHAADALRDLRQSGDAVDFQLDHHHDAASTIQLGFWIYLMSDCLIFSGLFATYALLSSHTAGGPAGSSLFDLPDVLAETMFLLVSSFTCGLATLAMNADRRNATVGWLAVTFLLGLGFISLEVREFAHMVSIGAGPDHSAFLSSFFTLVATHGLHVTCGLIFMAVMMAAVLKNGLNSTNRARLVNLSLFWHFLDIIWVGVFSLVYLSGVAH
ncbi:MAG TPA: cytochrome o ubiquinol oxidase subunit III [Steroidobacteraceae bacterium]|nr:cytochrome o ubiquinol oxidase subunit III [Steroidobacteraceae bacterium]